MPQIKSVAVDSYRAVSRLIEPIWTEQPFWKKAVIIVMALFAAIVYFRWNPRPKSIDLDIEKLSPTGQEAVRKVQKLYEESQNLEKVDLKSTYGPQNRVIPFIVKLFRSTLEQSAETKSLEKKIEAEQIAYVTVLLVRADLPNLRTKYTDLSQKQDHEILKNDNCYAGALVKTCCIYLKQTLSPLFDDLASWQRQVRYIELLSPRPKSIDLDLGKFSQEGQEALRNTRDLYKQTPDIKMAEFDSHYQPQTPVIPYLVSLYQTQLATLSESTKKQVAELAYVCIHLILEDLAKIKANSKKSESQILSDPEFYGKQLLLDCSLFLMTNPLLRDLVPRLKELKVAELVKEKDRPVFKAWEYYYSQPLTAQNFKGRQQMGPVHTEIKHAIALLEQNFPDRKNYYNGYKVPEESVVLEYTQLLFVVVWQALDEIPSLRAIYPELQKKTAGEIVTNPNCYINAYLKEAQKSLPFTWGKTAFNSLFPFKDANANASKLHEKLLPRYKELGLANLGNTLVAINDDYV